MVLLVQHLEDAIKSQLGGSVNPHLDALRIINGAGRWLTSHHGWRFLQSATATLGTTADQDHIPLGADVAEVFSIVPSDRVTSNFGYLDGAGDSLNILRQSVVTSTETYWQGNLEWRTDVTGKGGQRWPCLALTPTPTTTTADVFRIRYRAKWGELTAGDSAIDWPDYMDDLLMRAVMLRASGFEESMEDPVLFERHMAALEQSSEMRAARKADGRTWRRNGPMRGGAVYGVSPARSNFLATRVADPA